MIADLMPRHPVYVDLLAPDARAALGNPHADGHAALAMLRTEGFEWRGYVDIFDGGPTVEAATDAIRTVSGARAARVTGRTETAPPALAAAGTGSAFRAFATPLDVTADGVSIAPTAPAADAEEIVHAAF
jgi:arginine N-succinyltransferase